jgi:hypothetical protein
MKVAAADVSPAKAIARVADAVPLAVRGNIVIIGSLAAGYQLLRDAPAHQVRTKDVDCVISPRIAAVQKAPQLTEALLAHGWRPLATGKHATPGDAATPDDELPAVRLYPPQSTDWFIELMTVPESEAERGKHWTRIALSNGEHYGLPSFTFTALATWAAEETEYGISCARPEMMALANLLEHPSIRPDTIAGSLFVEGEIKRSNKDLGRALAIAHLTPADVVEQWPQTWRDGLEACFPRTWRELAVRAGDGLRALLASPGDLQEAVFTCNTGLLANRNVDADMLRITAERLLAFVVAPFEELAAPS